MGVKGTTGAYNKGGGGVGVGVWLPKTMLLFLTSLLILSDILFICEQHWSTARIGLDTYAVFHNPMKWA